jgi:hypothetical protein
MVRRNKSATVTKTPRNRGRKAAAPRPRRMLPSGSGVVTTDYTSSNGRGLMEIAPSMGPIPPWVKKLLSEMPKEARQSCLNLVETLSNPFASRPFCLAGDNSVPSFCITAFGRTTLATNTGGLTVIVLSISTLPAGSVGVSPVTAYQPASPTVAINSGVNSTYTYNNQSVISNMVASGGQVRCLGASIRITGAPGAGIQIIGGLVTGATTSSNIAGASWNNLYSSPMLRSAWCGSAQNFLTEVKWKPSDLNDLEFSSLLSGSGGTGGSIATSVPMIMINTGATSTTFAIEFVEHFEIQPGLGNVNLSQTAPSGAFASLASIWSAVSGMVTDWQPVITQIAGMATETNLYTQRVNANRRLY